MKIVIPGILFILIIAGYATACWMEIGKHTDKLWLHRCNSVEKYEEMKERFPNIETDIILRENSTAGFFDVTHDEEVSFHLPLDSILAHLRANREGKIWLDIKNLNTSNCLETRERLAKILEPTESVKKRSSLKAIAAKHLNHSLKSVTTRHTMSISHTLRTYRKRNKTAASVCSKMWLTARGSVLSRFHSGGMPPSKVDLTEKLICLHGCTEPQNGNSFYCPGSEKCWTTIK